MSRASTSTTTPTWPRWSGSSRSSLAWSPRPALSCCARTIQAPGRSPVVRRRFELKGAAAGVRVFDDYAHHPTEITATLRAAREVADGGRLVVAFQPHRYSRTAALGAELGQALGLADEVVVLEVYSAGTGSSPAEYTSST